MASVRSIAALINRRFALDGNGAGDVAMHRQRHRQNMRPAALRDQPGMRRAAGQVLLIGQRKQQRSALVDGFVHRRRQIYRGVRAFAGADRM